MKLNFRLNGVAVSLSAPPQTSLTVLLGSHLSPEHSLRLGCSSGECGLCHLMFDNSLACACRIPAIRVSGREITTASAIYDTAEYSMIKRGLEWAGVRTCGYCYPARLVAAYSLLSHKKPIGRSLFAAVARSVHCYCVNPNRFQQALSYMVDLTNKREHIGRDR